VFFILGIVHDFGMCGPEVGTEVCSVTLFFLMMSIGCVLERIWREKTGSKVQGPCGWLWSTI
jgi:hypothetical protein